MPHDLCAPGAPHSDLTTTCLPLLTRLDAVLATARLPSDLALQVQRAVQDQVAALAHLADLTEQLALAVELGVELPLDRLKDPAFLARLLDAEARRAR